MLGEWSERVELYIAENRFPYNWAQGYEHWVIWWPESEKCAQPQPEGSMRQANRGRSSEDDEASRQKVFEAAALQEWPTGPGARSWQRMYVDV
jgi:hypothetical protein